MCAYPSLTNYCIIARVPFPGTLSDAFRTAIKSVYFKDKGKKGNDYGK